MVSSSSNIRGNLRGTSSSLAAAAPQEEAGEHTRPKVRDRIEDIELNELDNIAQKRLKHLSIEIKFNINDSIHTTKASDTFHEYSDIRNILTSINEFKTTNFKKNRTPEAIDNLL
jgi:hypothetical protein